MRKAKVELFTSPTCPHCPHAAKAVREVLKERDDASLAEFSTMTGQGKRRAQQYMVMSVPTVIITGPGYPDPIGLRGTPSKKALSDSIDICLGLKDFEEPKGLWQSIKDRFSS